MKLGINIGLYFTKKTLKNKIKKTELHFGQLEWYILVEKNEDDNLLIEYLKTENYLNELKSVLSSLN